jgi:hypothetical protein
VCEAGPVYVHQTENEFACRHLPENYNGNPCLGTGCFILLKPEFRSDGNANICEELTECYCSLNQLRQSAAELLLLDQVYTSNVDVLEVYCPTLPSLILSDAISILQQHSTEVRCTVFETEIGNHAV